MRNLIGFFNRYSFFLLFLLLEVFAFFLLIQNNRHQRSRFLSSANEAIGQTYTAYSSVTDYLHLKEDNERLAQENARLREQHLLNYKRLYGNNFLIKDTIFSQQFRILKAKVVNNSVNKSNNYLTLNMGSLNGIESGMGVIGSSGVVGVVKNVSPHFCAVVSVLNQQSSISSKIKGSNYAGALQWKSPVKDYRFAELTEIPNHVGIHLGDTIVSSGFSPSFPGEIPIAVIQDFSAPEGDNFYRIKVRLLGDLKRISYAYIVKNTFRKEQEQLEEESREAADD